MDRRSAMEEIDGDRFAKRERLTRCEEREEVVVERRSSRISARRGGDIYFVGFLFVIQMATIDSEFECLNKLDRQLRCGMEFESEQSAYEFYNVYRRKMGFNIRKDTFEKNRRPSEITSRIFVYSKGKISVMF
ncbi:hypothetical protein Dsin_030201 [Dipteronia sinensis]|uniref:Protein FAR1-RELATED SEQUENCE n=1 Tax=Dipteronia sinensis TaxID=43782 RepID=A0AAE0DS85_9ROSI|nr:hypothetical protein Dsin_030201 [Dipteronia sinensis]